MAPWAGQYLPPGQGFEYTFAVNDAGQPGSYFPPYENSNWSITNVPNLEGDAAGAYLTDRLTDASLEFLQSNRHRPFFPFCRMHICDANRMTA